MKSKLSINVGTCGTIYYVHVCACVYIHVHELTPDSSPSALSTLPYFSATTFRLDSCSLSEFAQFIFPPTHSFCERIRNSLSLHTQQGPVHAKSVNLSSKEASSLSKEELMSMSSPCSLLSHCPQ